MKINLDFKIVPFRYNLLIANPDRVQTLSGLAIKRIFASIGGKTPNFWAFSKLEAFL